MPHACHHLVQSRDSHRLSSFQGDCSSSNPMLCLYSDLGPPPPTRLIDSPRGYKKLVHELSFSQYRRTHSTSVIMKFLYTLLACSLLASSHAASVISRSDSEPLRRSSLSTLPPVTELSIVNKVIAPDGFARS